jgi:hypothetical protein
VSNLAACYSSRCRRCARQRQTWCRMARHRDWPAPLLSGFSNFLSRYVYQAATYSGLPQAVRAAHSARHGHQIPRQSLRHLRPSGGCARGGGAQFLGAAIRRSRPGHHTCSRKSAGACDESISAQSHPPPGSRELPRYPEKRWRRDRDRVDQYPALRRLAITISSPSARVITSLRCSSMPPTTSSRSRRGRPREQSNRDA